MRLFNALLLSIGCLFFASAIPAQSYESYKVVSVSKYSLKSEFYKVKGNEFIFQKDLYVVFNQFNSLTDFKAKVIYQGKSHWASYELSFEYDRQVGCNEVRSANFWLNQAGVTNGHMVIGKSLSSSALQILQESHELIFDGNAHYYGTPILLTIDTASGIINGTIGDFSVESSPKDFDGAFEATLYSLDENGAKKNEGKLLLNIYGEENFVLAGAYLTHWSDYDITFLDQVK